MKKTLSNKEKKKLEPILSEYDLTISKKDKIEIIDDKIYMRNEKPFLFINEGRCFPSLKLILEENLDLPYISVDSGAISFVVSGADVMRPGIVEMSEFHEGDIVVVRDFQHKKPLAIGTAVVSFETAKMGNKGKVVKNIHHVGDDIWKL